MSPKVTDEFGANLRPEDWLMIGYGAGLLVWLAVDCLTSTPDRTRSRREQSTQLSEDHLRRLEDGETISVRRWHGHNLVLAGSLVVDADRFEESDR